MSNATIHRRQPASAASPSVPVDAQWNADPISPQPFDPQVYIDCTAQLCCDNLKTIRGLIERHRDTLRFADVVAALRDIDDARSMTLGHLGLIADRPLVRTGRLL